MREIGACLVPWLMRDVFGHWESATPSGDQEQNRPVVDIDSRGPLETF
jgi:hypothetical protein